MREVASAVRVKPPGLGFRGFYGIAAGRNNRDGCRIVAIFSFGTLPGLPMTAGLDAS